MEPLDERGRRRLPVHDVGADSPRMIEEPHGIRGAQGGRLRGIEEQTHDPLHAFVAHQDIPVTVDHESGEGLLLAEHEIEGAAHLGHLRRFKPSLEIHRRIAGGQEQLVAAARRHVEHAREQKDHLPARLRAPGLDEAQVARGDLGLHGQGELAHPTALAPLAEQGPQRALRGRLALGACRPRSRHVGSLHCSPEQGHYLGGN